MRKPKKFETHLLIDALESGKRALPACITKMTLNPNEVTCRRCLLKMGLIQAPQRKRAGRVKRIVDGIVKWLT